MMIVRQLMLVLFVIMAFGRLDADNTMVFLSDRSTYERLPEEVTGNNVDLISGYGQNSLLIKSGQDITIYGDSTITMISIPEKIKLSDVCYDPETGYMFLSSGKSIYALNTLNNHFNKFISRDVGNNKIAISEGKLYIYCENQEVLLRIPMDNDDARCINIGSCINAVAAIDGGLLVATENGIIHLGEQSVIPIASINETINSLAATDKDWIAYCTNNEVGIIIPGGRKLQLRTAGAKQVYYQYGVLYMVDLDGRVSVFSNIYDGIARLISEM